MPKSNNKTTLLLNPRFMVQLTQIIDSINDFAHHLFAYSLYETTDEFMSSLRIKESDKYKLMNIYIWWQIFTEPIAANQDTIFQLFYRRNILRKKHPRWVKQLLSEWRYIQPSFYVIEEIVNNDWILVTDYVNKQDKLINMKEELIDGVRNNQVLTGVIAPIGEGMYISLTDVFLFREESAIQLVKSLLNEHKDTNRSLSHYPFILRRSIQLMNQKGVT